MRNYRKEKRPKTGVGSKRTKREGILLCGGHYEVLWDDYHKVPAGWHKGEIIAAHHQLGGVVPIGGPVLMARGIREPTADENEWFGYKRALYQIADGLLVGDRACIELAIRYIELRWIGSYSGYIRALLARRLKHVDLGKSEQKRLIRHFENIVANGDYTAEFREYEKLWKCIAVS